MSVLNKNKFTNGAYTIEGRIIGIWRFKRIIGTIILSNYPDVYAINCQVNFPLYHLFWDEKPQFYLES